MQGVAIACGERRRVSGHGAAAYGMGGERAYAPVTLARRVEAIGYHHRTTGRCALAPPVPCGSAVAPSPLGSLISRVT